jgi:hypothetical protein
MIHNKIKELKKDSVIYILCPGNMATGGIEALHQLRYYLDRCGFTAFLAYYYDPYIHPRYLCYEPKVVPLEEIKDEKNNVVIAPEVATFFLKKYHYAAKCIWWLSLVFYDGDFNTVPIDFKHKIRKIITDIIPISIIKRKIQLLFKQGNDHYPYRIEKNDLNLTGSKFAYSYVGKRYKNTKMFVEPISMDFLKAGAPELSSQGRSNIIPYNPAKPSDIMNKLLQRTDLQFVPIKNMTPQQIIELFRKSKLYIDFGFFGGPERMPKESVHNGTLLLVGKRNAAKNDFDVAIPNEFKIKDYNNEELVVEKIKYMLHNYDSLIGQFEPFRKKILALEENFIRAIREIFVYVD